MEKQNNSILVLFKKSDFVPKDLTFTSIVKKKKHSCHSVTHFHLHALKSIFNGQVLKNVLLDEITH